MAKVKELRGMPEAELRQRLIQLRSELSTMRLKARQGTVEQPHKIRQTRREIATVLTVLGEPSTAAIPVSTAGERQVA